MSSQTGNRIFSRLWDTPQRRVVELASRWGKTSCTRKNRKWRNQIQPNSSKLARNIFFASHCACRDKQERARQPKDLRIPKKEILPGKNSRESVGRFLWKKQNEVVFESLWYLLPKRTNGFARLFSPMLSNRGPEFDFIAQHPNCLLKQVFEPVKSLSRRHHSIVYLRSGCKIPTSFIARTRRCFRKGPLLPHLSLIRTTLSGTTRFITDLRSYVRTRRFQLPIRGVFETGLIGFHRGSLTRMKSYLEYKMSKLWPVWYLIQFVNHIPN